MTIKAKIDLLINMKMNVFHPGFDYYLTCELGKASIELAELVKEHNL
jgi:hypothetical protein